MSFFRPRAGCPGVSLIASVFKEFPFREPKQRCAIPSSPKPSG